LNFETARAILDALIELRQTHKDQKPKSKDLRSKKDNAKSNKENSSNEGSLQRRERVSDAARHSANAGHTG
jgi:hypothetical protein